MSPIDSLEPGFAYRSGGVLLHTRRLGRGPRVVLLHGGPGLDHHVMLPLALPLAERFEVWLPDLPGHGHSHEGSEGLPGLTTLIEHTSRWVGDLDPAPDFVVGHSLGAWLVRSMVARCRVRPRAAVLMAPPMAGPETMDVRRARSWAGARRGRRQARGGELAREFLEVCGAEVDGELTPQFVESIRRAKLREATAYSTLLGEFRRALREPLAPWKGECPVLLLAGDADSLCGREQIEGLATSTPSSSVRVLSGAGHMLFAAGPAPVVKPILEFFDEVSARR